MVHIAMEIEDLKKSMKSMIDKQLPIQAVFNYHFAEITAFLEFGYNQPKLNTLLGLDIKVSYFQTLYKRAKAKQAVIDKTKQSATSIAKKEKPALKIQKPDLEKKNPLSEWKLLFHDIGENLINDITDHGYDLNDVKTWISDNNIISSTQLRSHVNRVIENQSSHKKK